ncbi:hypothetical protein D3C81_2301800 [compost metagenome]
MSGGFGVTLNMAKLLEKWSGHLSLRNENKVAAVRGFADQDSRNPADPKVSHAQPP